MESLLPVGTVVEVAHPATLGGDESAVHFYEPVEGVVVLADDTDGTYLVKANRLDELSQWVDAASVKEA